MTVRSAGILLYRRNAPELEVWIAHMGGPFWEHKDQHAWSIPKGEYLGDEDPLVAAKREFSEEIGAEAPAVEYFPLGTFRQPSGKLIMVFVAESDFEPGQIVSNTFELEWPKGSGVVRSYPEIDHAAWMGETVARTKLVKGQVPVLDALLRHLTAE